MVKDQDYLEKTASFCIDLAKKLGATDATAASRVRLPHFTPEQSNNHAI